MTDSSSAVVVPASTAQSQSELFLADALAGLSVRPKFLPCKYFYDAHGSRLFDEITGLVEYYPTRTELGIMELYVEEMVECFGPRCLLVEYGSGSSLKTRVLLEHMVEPAGYVPIDISTEHLADSVRTLKATYPHLDIRPISADYTTTFVLPNEGFGAARVVVYFPGSTIGNFRPAAAREFLARMASVAGASGGLLIGVDLHKDASVLEAAYNDTRGVTAAFNKNLLRRMNRELGTSFDLDAFGHEAVYNRREGRIEMYLVSKKEQAVGLDGHRIRFDAGERIHTEYSYKYTLDRFADLAASAGLKVRKVWVDADGLFSVQYLDRF